MRIETLAACDSDGDFIGQLFQLERRWRWTCDRCHRQRQYSKQNSPMDYVKLTNAVRTFEEHVRDVHGTEI